MYITHHQNVLESQEIKTFFVAPKTMALSKMKLKSGTGVQSNFCQRVSGILYSSLPIFFKLWKFIDMVHKVSQALSECLCRLMIEWDDFLNISGQLISKCLQFSQKTNENNSTWDIIVVGSNFFVSFLEEIRIPKSPFEIYRPLIWTLFGHPGFSLRPFQVELWMS